MKEFEELIMALYNNNYNLQRFLPPEKEPPVLAEFRFLYSLGTDRKENATHCCAAAQQQDQRENTICLLSMPSNSPRTDPKKRLDFI
jgi:hypothetical protein